MVIKISDNDNFSSKHHTEELTIDERQEFITTIKNLTQSLSNLEVLNRTIQEQVRAYQEQAKNQILSTYNILSQSNCLSKYNYGVIGLTSIIEGCYMQKAFRQFTKSPTNKKYRNKCIYLHIKNTSIKTFITNKINIKNNKPFIDYNK